MANDDGRETVRRTLATRLDPPDAAAAAERWASEFQSLPGFGIVRFIATIGGEYGLDEQDRRRLRLELFGVLHENAGGGQQRAGAPAPGQGDDAPAAAPVVAATLLSQLAQAVAPRNWDEFHSGLLDNLDAGSPIDAVTRRRLEQWQKPARVPPLPDREEELRTIIHAAYLAACDASGPAAADRDLATAVRACDGLAEARAFPPQRLL